MDFCIVYGRSGSGKTKYIYQDIKNNINNKKIYLVVPEQSNLTAEQNLFKELQIDTLIDIEVLTLSRMATRVLESVGEKSRKILTQVGKNMIIYDILSKEKNSLKFLGKSDKNIDIVSNLITEFKKHNIDTEFLNNVNIEDEYTRLKLEDIRRIYQKYEEKIRGKFIDENDELTLLYQNIGNVDIFKDAIIYFDDFLGFTSQEYRIFEELIKLAKKVTVTVPTDSLIITDKENDIFYFNKKFANKLSEIASNNGVETKTIYLDKNYRTEKEDLVYLEKSLTKNSLSKYNEDCPNIKLNICDNPYQEIENVAQKIFKLVKEENYRYKDIVVIAGSVEEYRDDIKTIFEKYNIPVFVDEKKELNRNILVKYIISIINVFSKGWSYESVLGFIKIGLTEIDYLDLCEFENYCLKWGIRNKKWFEKFEYEPVNDKQSKFENIRKQIINPLREFQMKILENKTVYELTKELYNFLINNNINVLLDKKIKKINYETENLEIINEYNTSYNILVKLLDEIVFIFGDEKVSFEKYKEILQVGLNSCELGKIPAMQDGVIFGDISRTRGSNIKVEFLIGVNDGLIPSNNRVEGYFNDNDRSILLNSGMELAKDSKDNMYEEQFNIYRMLTLPSDRILISYCLSDKSGTAIRPSILIKKLSKLFDIKKENANILNITNYKSTFEESVNLYQETLNGNDVSDEWLTAINYFKENASQRFEDCIRGIDYTNKAEQISDENIKKLYGKDLVTSISRLEQYRGCPFSFHMKYGLKLQEKRELKVRNIDTGNFMHEVIEEFFGKLNEQNLNINEIDDAQIEEIVVKIINELFQTSKYYIFSSTAKFKILTRRLKKVVLNSIKYIVYTLKNSKFEVLGSEVEFSRKSEFKPIIVKLDDGSNVEITGKIDRVDIGKLNDKQYVRIIDYKSSIKNLDFNKVVTGLQIQLITYLDDICAQSDFEPSGILYMSLIDNIVRSKKNMPDEEILNGIKKNFKMQGVILADIEVAKMMDTKLESGYSDIVPLALNKDGGIIESRSSVLKKEEFDKLQKKVKNIIKQISSEILKGNIDIKPYYYKKNTACDYCQYKTICRFTPGVNGNEYDYIHYNNKEDILEEIGKEGL